MVHPSLPARLTDGAVPPWLRSAVELAWNSFLGRCVRRFIAIQGIDRSVVLASQAFTALIPLLILAASVAPDGSEDAVSQLLIRRLGLTGEGADAVTVLFDIPDAAAGTVSVFSALLLLASGTSFARRVQKMYLAAWEEEKRGVRSGVYAAAGLLVLMLEILVLYAARSLVQHLPASWAFTLPISLVAGIVLWTSIPHILLNRRLPWRRLVFGGVVAAVGTTVYSLVTSLYMPSLVNRYTEQFGLFGITIALIGWLLVIAGIIVASAAIGAEFDQSHDRWVRALKARLGHPEPEEPGVSPQGRAAPSAGRG